MATAVRLLGSFALRVEGAWCAPAPTKQHLLLAYLAYRGEWVSRAQLAALFWADMPEEQARTNLRQRLQSARSLAWAEGLEIEKHRLRWALPNDVADFKAANARQAWGEALKLYTGPLLAGVEVSDAPLFEAWLEGARGELEAAFHTAALNHATELSSRGDHDDAAALLLRLLHRDPLAEDVLQVYMREALMAGQRADALAHFRAFRTRLATELGLEPLPETIRLAEAFSQAVALNAAPPAYGAHTAPLWLLRPPRLIGREVTVGAVAGARSAVVLLGGEPGVGKTHLAEEIAPDALKLRFHEGLQPLPYAPLAEHIRGHLGALPDLGPYTNDLARVVPEVAPDARPEPLDAAFAKARLFEGLARYVEARTRAPDGCFALLLDDLQWADRASLEWLAYLAATSRVRVLGTFRQGEVGRALKRTLSSLEASGNLKIVHVGALTKGNLSELLSDLGGETRATEAFTDWLCDKSGGNPFFALQTLRALVETGGLTTDSRGWRLDLTDAPPPQGSVLPEQVSALVRQRAARLGEVAERVLGAASVVGGGFDARTLAPLVTLSEGEVEEALIGAEQAGMIEEGRFLHDLLREGLYAAVPSRQRRLWHRQVAEGQGDPVLAAEHWWQAGDTARAVAGWLEGARSLSGRGLMHEAAEMLGRALVHAPDHAGVRARLAHVHLHAAHFDDAEREAKGLLKDDVPAAERLWATLTLTELALRRGRSREAFRRAQEGIALLEGVPEAAWPPGALPTFCTMLSIWGENEVALALLESRLRGGGTEQLEYAYTLSSKGFVLEHLDRTREACALYEEALELAEGMNARHLTVHVMAFLALSELYLGDYDEIIPRCEAALALGSYQYTPLLKIQLAHLYLETGRYEETLKLADEVLAMHPDKNFLGQAWALRMDALAGLGRDVRGAIEGGFTQLVRTDFPNTHARLLGVILEFGSPEQRGRALHLVDALPQGYLVSYYRERLRRTLARIRAPL